MSIITYPLDGVTYSAEDVAVYLCTRTSGVYSKESNFSVSITGTRQITVAPGLAWINYDDFKGVSVCSRENTVLTVSDADNTLNRVDRVVLQFDTSDNLTAIKLKTGTPAVAAQPPEILQNHNQYELGLCTISVPAGSTAVTAADITDTRADEDVCGLMRDGVTGIPTAQLQTQFTALLDNLRQSISNVDSGSFYTKAQVDALLKGVNPFPVGSIYQTTGSTSPASLFGGTWTEIASERVLMGASTSHAAGSTVDAGLPNITGKLSGFGSYYASEYGGAFSGTRNSAYGCGGDGSTRGYAQVATFDASRSSAVYGGSDTVQPAAYYVHIWRRTA